MKLSLSWIFDHLMVPLSSVDRASLYTLLNEKVVELDTVHELTLDSSQYAVASFDGTLITAHTATTSFSVTLADRADLVLNESYLIALKDTGWQWATMHDLGSSKESLLPALACRTTPAEVLSAIEWTDTIIEISNSSLTHRPDLWCHRGFAREISVLLDIPLTPLPSVDIPIQKELIDSKISRSPTFPFDITIETEYCTRFVATAITVTQRSSIPFVAARLSRIDIRPIDAVVDGTNYVMATIGHPLHAFDGAQIHNNTLRVTQKAGESLVLLDQQKITTTQDDIIICDDAKPLSLAGVMGGTAARVIAQSSTLLIEAACFAPATIRATAQRHKKKTEAATRFEKGLDGNQAVEAVKQYLYYAQQYQLINELPASIVDRGTDTTLKTIRLQHTEINTLLGCSIDSSFVHKVLTQLGCMVTQQEEAYTITVPSWRTHEIDHKENIIEEIGRIYGYTRIPPQAPAIPAQGTVHHKRSLIEHLRTLLAFGMSMHELKSYAFLDEGFVRSISWIPDEPLLEVALPVSQNWKRLTHSLVPGLLKAVVTNGAQHKQSRFFEIAPVWHIHKETRAVTETLSVAFVINDAQSSFYQSKAIVDMLIQLCGKKVTWTQCTKETAPFWLMPFESAALMYEQQCIGYAGMLHERIHTALGKDVAKHIFVAHLSLDGLTANSTPLTISVPGKYQSVWRDITFWVPKTCTAATVLATAQRKVQYLIALKQLSFLEKEEWTTHRALTLRCTIGSSEKTLTLHEIDAVVATIIQNVHALGVTVK